MASRSGSNAGMTRQNSSTSRIARSPNAMAAIQGPRLFTSRNSSRKNGTAKWNTISATATSRHPGDVRWATQEISRGRFSDQRTRYWANEM